MNAFDDATLDMTAFSWRDLFGLDKWETWTPVRTSWTDVGTIVVTAKYNVRGRICHFSIKVVPGTSIATTAGTSYVSLPIPAKGLGGIATMVNRTANTAVGVCVIDETNSRVYPPAQVASGNTFYLNGSYEI